MATLTRSGPQVRATEAHLAAFGTAGHILGVAPGRVNLMGDHTDYNGGWVLPVAIDRSAAVAFTPAVGECRVVAEQFGETDGFSPVEPFQQIAGWRAYVRALVAAAREAGLPVAGFTAAIAGDVPLGGGLSSSAALELALLSAMAAAWQWRIAPKDLALLAQHAENRYVGVACGPMDQLASALGRRDGALAIDCRTLGVEPVSLGLEARGAVLVVLDTGVSRSLATAGYNQRRLECEEGLAWLNERTGAGAASLGEVPEREFWTFEGEMPDVYRCRLRHYFSEVERVHATIAALGQGDLARVGKLMDQSHASLERDFAVSCPELDQITSLARKVPGVLGARMTGAGFGGCAVALALAEAVPALEAALEHYATQSGRRGGLMVVHAAEGAYALESLGQAS